ncbi:MAG: NAD(P)H-dependent oxidoreductase [Burkholderiales bacterium]|nr:NAD(P)H-dependent oxidoreductase [Burkholderiales bacterium]
MADILVLVAHPQMQHSRVCRALLGAAGRAGAHIERRDLYRLYPDYLVDVEAEQAALAAARLVVWLHPIHWYSMPPLMKLWLDEVFAFGWAYGPGGLALAGKDLWLAASTGGDERSYRPEGHNRYFFDEFLHPYEQTAALAGMRWLPPLLLHGALRASDDAVAAHAEVFADRLRRYPDWPEIADLEPDADCRVPADARPLAAADA